MLQNVWNVLPLARVSRRGCMNLEEYAKNLYPSEHGEQYYKELLEKIGFKHVRAFNVEKGVQFLSDKCFKENFLEGLMDNLEISPEDSGSFKAEVLELFEKTFGRYEGKRCNVSVHLNLAGVKPMESSDLNSMEKSVV